MHHLIAFARAGERLGNDAPRERVVERDEDETRAPISAPVVEAPANPIRQSPLRYAETRQNLIANPSVELDLTGWSSFTSDQELTVNYRRDDHFGSHGTASLRQDIVNSLNASSSAAAYWIYPVAADPSWWGRRAKSGNWPRA